MELQTFINNNTDYTSKFRELNLNTKKYGELGLLIVTYKYDFKYDFDENPFIKFCKGAIIRLDDNKVICLPVKKCTDKHDLSNCSTDSFNEDNMTLQPLLDGTMINMFYHNDEWFLSTRSYIGAKNKWDQNISFKKMFEDIVKEKNINFDELNKKHSYSFVLQHKENRIISEIVDNNLIMVQEYSPETFLLQDFEDNIYKSFTIIKNNDMNVLHDSLNKPFNFQFKGFTIKDNKSFKRINFVNSQYQYVFDLKSKANFNNKLLAFLYLRNNKLLTEYLKYFNDDAKLFDSYRNIVYIMKNELHDCYVKYFIKKEIQKKDIPYQLKPVLYELHTLYKQQQVKITNEVVNNYIYVMPIKRLCFILNYYLN